MNDFKVQGLALVILFAFPFVIVSSANANSNPNLNPFRRLEALDVERVVSRIKGNECTSYKVLLGGHANRGGEIVQRCLLNADAKGHSVWLIDNKSSRIVDAFPVYIYFDGGDPKRVIKIGTEKIHMDISNFLNIIIPHISNGSQEPVCVVSGVGYMEVDHYFDYLAEMKERYVKNIKSVQISNEEEIKALQPWCDVIEK